MFRDQQRELDRLEQALLEQDTQEEIPEEIPEETPAEEIPDNVIYNNDSTDVDPEDFGKDVYDPPKKTSLLPLAIAFCFLTAAFCFFIWYMLKNGGFLG